MTCVKTDICSTHHAGPPSNVSLIARSSRNLTMTWNSPTSFTEQHGLFVAYVVKCWSGEHLTTTSTLENVTQVTIDDCIPYQVYNCCVSLQTTLANSTEICQQQRTFEGGSCNVILFVRFKFTCVLNVPAPESPPSNISFDNSNPFSVIVYWNAPVMPNGVITLYILYVRYENGTVNAFNVVGERTSYNITNLHPYQQIIVEVTASTRIGEGPSSVSKIRTAQASMYLLHMISLSLRDS